MTRIKDVFMNGDVDSKAMFRYWFPDAGASLERVAEQVKSIFEAGFGGVEVAMVPQYVDFDPAEYGWGTRRWLEIMKTVMRTAMALPDHFKVDFTITAHWPPALNTIDPNHPAALKELSFAFKKITDTSLQPLPTPERRLTDGDKGGEAGFIFTDRFVAATIARIKGLDGNKVILDIESLRDVSDHVSLQRDANGDPVMMPAGIPENETQFGSKTRLADQQLHWQIDLAGAGVAASAGDHLQAGDWLLFSHYMRGTGQTLSGREMRRFNFLQLPMADRMYATDYYSTEGTDAITSYWDEHFLADPEFRMLIEKCGGAIFEDSIESSSSASIWTNRFAEEFFATRGYDIRPFLPFIQSIKGSRQLFITGTRQERHVIEDYFRTLNDLYLRDHLQRIQKWTHGFGCQYRAQPYGGCVDTSTATVLLDITEGESLGFGTSYDHFRNIAGGVHMTGRKFVSDEALADLMKAYSISWKDMTFTLNQNWSAGVNRMVIHGMAFDRESSGKFSQWPGWHAFQNMFADPWGDRQPYWSFVRPLARYISRTQAVLQNGLPRIDLAIYKNQKSFGRGFEFLLDEGYTYDIISTPHLLLDSARTEKGRLCPDGPGYRALIINDQEALPLAAAMKITELAEAGLPVLLVGQIPCRAAGYNDSDDRLYDLMDELLRHRSVRYVDNAADLPAALRQEAIRPSAVFSQKGLRTYCRQDGDSRYYYFFNSGDVPVSTEVNLEGEGCPVRMDAWTGEFERMTAFEATHEGVQGILKLEGGQSLLLVLPGQDEPLENLKAVGRSDRTASLADNQLHAIEPASWEIEIESWGPGSDPTSPAVPDKRNVCFTDQQLGYWDDLPATQQLLADLGVTAMSQISGIGRYRSCFTAPACSGSYLKVTSGDDMVVAGLLNGKAIPPVDPATGEADLSGLLVAGVNTIELTLATTLINRLKVSNPFFMNTFTLPPPPHPGEADERGMADLKNDFGIEPEVMPPMPSQPKPFYQYGIRRVEIKPYLI